MKSKYRLVLSLIATALWLWFIFARSLRDANASDAESGAVLELIRKLLPFVTMHGVRKLAHFTEFFILGGLLFLDWRLWGRGGLWLPPAVGIAAAAADEFLQTSVPGRSGQLSDVLLDFSGIACAGLIGLLFSRRKEKKTGGRRKETD